MQVTTILGKEQIEQLAPDQDSLVAALKLMKPANWPVLAFGEGEPLLWGECQGSGSTPYRVVVSPADITFKCTCPSRKLPCKHALALLLMACDAPQMLGRAAPPDWVAAWQARRRPRAAPARSDEQAGAPAPPGGSLAEAVASRDLEDGRATDPRAAARVEAQRQRVREEREAQVLAGLDEVDRWIADQINLGLAGFAKRAGEGVRALSTRLVDRKAPGLASRLDMLAADLLRVPEAGHDDLVIERLAGLALISAAYRNQDRLPAGLREDVRRAVGWTVKREELLADPDAPRVASTWFVVAPRSEVQPNALRRLETWLLDAAPPDGAARFALLIDYAPASLRGAAPPFAAGEVVAGEVVYYPSAMPLRAVLATRAPADPALAWPELPRGLGPGLAACQAGLARLPWRETWPLAAGGVTVVPTESDGLALVDAAGAVLPLDGGQTLAALPLLGLGTIAALATSDGRSATLLAADTAIGRWYAG